MASKKNRVTLRKSGFGNFYRSKNHRVPLRRYAFCNTAGWQHGQGRSTLRANQRVAEGDRTSQWKHASDTNARAIPVTRLRNPNLENAIDHRLPITNKNCSNLNCTFDRNPRTIMTTQCCGDGADDPFARQHVNVLNQRFGWPPASRPPKPPRPRPPPRRSISPSPSRSSP